MEIPRFKPICETSLKQSSSLGDAIETHKMSGDNKTHPENHISFLLIANAFHYLNIDDNVRCQVDDSFTELERWQAWS
jgi:hypothetical protein